MTALPVTPGSTYRIQMQPRFTFADAARAVPYLAGLGVTHLHLSPVLESAPGSRHGYDVVDHTRVRAELGGEQGLRGLSRTAREHGMGLILDIVPNHMAVPTPEYLNRPLWEVLRDGPSSPYARWFDIDWAALDGRVLLPVLGEPLPEALGDLAVVRDKAAGGKVLRYHDHRFPLRRGTEKLPLHKLLNAQWYRLSYWRAARTELNYRRFFTVSDLIAVRVEDPEVFAATHATVLRLLHEDVVQGLRVDHPDGLADPAGYLRRLSEATEGRWTVVEKILQRDETLPADWACAGTTGYDALDRIDGLFTDPDGVAELSAFYREFTGTPDDRGGVWSTTVRRAAYRVITQDLAAEAARLCRAAERASRRGALRHPVAPAGQSPYSPLDDPRFPNPGARPPQPSAYSPLDDPRFPHPGAGRPAQLPYGGRARAQLTYSPLDDPRFPHPGANQGQRPSPGPARTQLAYSPLDDPRFPHPGANQGQRPSPGPARTQLAYSPLDDPRFPHPGASPAQLPYGAPARAQLPYSPLDDPRFPHPGVRVVQPPYSAHDIEDVLRELLVGIPVYRPYVRPGAFATGTDVALLNDAARAARARCSPELFGVLDFVRDLALGRGTGPDADDFAVRFAQVASALHAKSVEDTAFYRYGPLLSLCEVGRDPSHPTTSLQEFHAYCAQLLHERPATGTVLSTHDTKRSADLRMRLAVLSEMPETWREFMTARAWRAMQTEAPLAPDPHTAYTVFQTGVGLGFCAPERLVPSVLKAARESGLHTSWTEPDEGYERALTDFTDEGPCGVQVYDIALFNQTLDPYAKANSLGAALLHLTMPGVPDVYQGCEFPVRTLVDPDNRGTFDEPEPGTRRFAVDRTLRQLLDGEPPTGADDLKLLLTALALRLRRAEPDWYGPEGSYRPLAAEGPAGGHCVAFVRGGGAVTAVTRLSRRLEESGGWRDTLLHLPPGGWRDTLTGMPVAGPVRLAELFATHPVALLTRDWRPVGVR